MGSQTGSGLGHLGEEIKVVCALALANVSASAGGITIDRKGFNSMFLASIAGAKGGSGTLTPKIQHSDTDVDGDFVDATVGAFGAIAHAAIEENTQHGFVVDLRGMKRYVRVYNTLASTSLYMAQVAILGAPDVLPTSGSI